MFHFRFQGGQKLAILWKHRQVEVVVVIGDNHLTGSINANTNRIIGDTYFLRRKKMDKGFWTWYILIKIR